MLTNNPLFVDKTFWFMSDMTYYFTSNVPTMPIARWDPTEQ